MPQGVVDVGHDAVRHMANLPLQDPPIDSVDPADVGKRVLRQAGSARGNSHDAGIASACQACGQEDDDDRVDCAIVEVVCGNDDGGPAVARLRARRLPYAGPPDLPMTHSLIPSIPRPSGPPGRDGPGRGRAPADSPQMTYSAAASSRLPCVA